VDVYSFGLVLYEMVALELAYSDVCIPGVVVGAAMEVEFARRVFGDNERPPLDRLRAPPAIREILPSCWHGQPEYRFDMATVNVALRKELILLRRGDESALPNFARRRSSSVFSFCDRSREGSSYKSIVEESVTQNSVRVKLAADDDNINNSSQQ
jgi:hypothetical protein